MKIYLTPTTAYGRLVRVALLETGLDARVQRVFVKTRVPDCVLNDLNPTAKVPTLETDDGLYLGEARLICQYLDALHDGTPIVDTNPAPAARQFDGVVTGFLDGVSVWVREMHRPECDRSASILGQERARGGRCLAWLERRVAEIESASRYVQLSLFVALECIDTRLAVDDWRERQPALGNWYQQCLSLNSIIAMKAQTG